MYQKPRRKSGEFSRLCWRSFGEPEGPRLWGLGLGGSGEPFRLATSAKVRYQKASPPHLLGWSCFDFSNF